MNNNNNNLHCPRKRYGQNFLTDQNIIQKIVHSLHVRPQDNLVEIGPGLGALTALVLAQINHLHVLEIDRDLSQRLQETYSEAQLNVHQQDALKFDFATLCPAHQKLRIFGNLPYNISTPLLFHLLQYAAIIQDMLFMLQKEVVIRMGSAPNSREYGRLSVMIQYHCQVDILFHVNPQAFSPPPKVMSSIVRLKPYAPEENRPHPLAIDYPHFAQVVANAFGHRRKTLKNALGPLASIEDFNATQIDPMRRPETLSISEFVNLSNYIKRENCV
jgi:16S rRNA (adenine1518-N6/adenine1519-N6)-dimethyltransferase